MPEDTPAATNIVPVRDFNIPAPWARDALTTIPPVPIDGASYRRTDVTESEFAAGQGFNVVHPSGIHNAKDYAVSGVAQMSEIYGFIPWSPKTKYMAHASFALGSDGIPYRAIQATGPGTMSGSINPVEDTGGLYWQSLGSWLSYGGGFGAGIWNTRDIIETGGEYEVQLTGWHKITIIGGGGGGGGSYYASSQSTCGGGGGEGEKKEIYKYLTKGDKITVTIGAGGNGGGVSVNGQNGGNSTVIIEEVTYSAEGGFGGIRGRQGAVGLYGEGGGSGLSKGHKGEIGKVGGMGQSNAIGGGKGTYGVGGNGGDVSGGTASGGANGANGVVVFEYFTDEGAEHYRDLGGEYNQGGNRGPEDEEGGYVGEPEYTGQKQWIYNTASTYTFEAPVTGMYEIQCIAGGSNCGVYLEQRTDSDGALTQSYMKSDAQPGGYTSFNGVVVAYGRTPTEYISNHFASMSGGVIKSSLRLEKGMKYPIIVGAGAIDQFVSSSGQEWRRKNSYYANASGFWGYICLKTNHQNGTGYGSGAKGFPARNCTLRASYNQCLPAGIALTATTNGQDGACIIKFVSLE